MSTSERTSVVVRSADDDVAITVTDAYGTVVGTGRGELQLELQTGLYLARASRLGSTTERSFIVPEEMTVMLESPAFLSAVPLRGARNCPTDVDAVADELEATCRPAPDESSGALLLAVIGEGSTPELEKLELRDFSGELVIDLSNAQPGLRVTMIATCVHLPPGVYELRHRPLAPTDRAARSIAIPVGRGRTTWVFVRASPRPVVQHAGIVIGGRRGGGFDPDDELLRVTELSLRGLLDGDPYFPASLQSHLMELEDPAPLALVAAAHTALRRDDAEAAAEIVDRALAVADDLVDVAALALAIGRIDANTDLFDMPPTTRAGFDAVVAAAATDDEIVPYGSVVERLAACLYEDSPWTCWDPDAVDNELEWIATGIRDLRVGRLIAAGVNPELDASDLGELAAAMRLPRRLVEATYERLRLPLVSGPPYPGLAAYTEGDKGIFFGREHEVSAVVEQLETRRIVVLAAASGGGKSSLIDAGVVPAVIAKHWTVRRAVLDGAQSDIDIAALRPDGDPTLLIVDHFETALRVPGTDAADLWSEINAFVKLEGARLLLAVRADAYGDLIAAEFWGDLEPFMLPLPPMRPEAIARAIELPAETCDVVLERDLVDRLVADCSGEPGALPLLQQTLRRIWSAASYQFIPLSTYESLRFPPDASDDAPNLRCGLNAAIALHAEDVWTNEIAVDAELQSSVRRLFLRLIEFDDGLLRARRAQLGDFDAEGDPGLRAAADLLARPGIRLVTLGKHSTVELSYELLLVAWPRLQGWAVQEAASELLRRALQSEAIKWSSEGSHLLDARRRNAHREAMEWRASVVGPVSPQIERYLEAGTRLARRQTIGKLLGLAMLVALAAYGVLAIASAIVDADKKNGARVELVAVVGPAGGFRIEATEVSNARFRACVELGACTRPREPAGIDAFERADDELPVVFVDGFQAAAFCDWLGLRLPTRDEWYDAVTDGATRNYPWGDDPPSPELINMVFDVGDTSVGPTDADLEELAARPSVTADDILAAVPELDESEHRTVAEFFAADWPEMDVEERVIELERLRAEAAGRSGEGESDRIERELAGAPAPVADEAYGAGATPTGIRHLIGNVEEWTATPADCGPSARRCDLRWDGVTAVSTVSAVGGSFTDPGLEVGPATLEPTYRQPLLGALDRGFRCAGSR